MSTQAQTAANKVNAQLSTGPKSEAGKATSCLNNFRHGFTGAFTVLPHEDRTEFDTFFAALQSEHQPATSTEGVLVERMAQAQWLVKRALCMQEDLFRAEIDTDPGASTAPDLFDRRLALYIRYQTTNERAFTRCLHDLLKIRAERRKEQFGFESQRQKAADLARKESIESRKQELHACDLILAEARHDHQILLNLNLVPSGTPKPFDLVRHIRAAKAA